MSESGVNRSRRRDALWDGIRALAIVRVVAWHTWQWAPLSWFAAMPVMFVVTGVMFQQSIERHGYRRMVVARLRRLMLPFWVFATAAVSIMLSLGWRPSTADLLPWIVPLVDPEGSRLAPGLWIPHVVFHPSTMMSDGVFIDLLLGRDLRDVLVDAAS